MKAQKARISDVPQMHKLINTFAEKGKMLARPLSEIYENIRDYFVIREGDQVVACAALHISWSDLAEVKSLAVDESRQKRDLGRALVAACIQEARDLGIPTVFCLTYQNGFFEKCGFRQVIKEELPHKIWGECYRCPKFPNCDEVALTFQVEAGE
jgi:amino-acid N-acetyltransferase